ncbi:hypothetical protein VNO78_03888 [Psophocarpus tetragonolobus]|uniref:Uncharacterized protein n=1 Tax=Psophocarpus tetragonolobus TaxID=3891 RepID=A0AAN9XWH0_PSOTE
MRVKARGYRGGSGTEHNENRGQMRVNIPKNKKGVFDRKTEGANTQQAHRRVYRVCEETVGMEAKEYGGTRRLTYAEVTARSKHGSKRIWKAVKREDQHKEGRRISQIINTKVIEETVMQINQCCCWLKEEVGVPSEGSSVGSQDGQTVWLNELAEDSLSEGTSLEEEDIISLSDQCQQDDQ